MLAVLRVDLARSPPLFARFAVLVPFEARVPFEAPVAFEAPEALVDLAPFEELDRLRGARLAGGSSASAGS